MEFPRLSTPLLPRRHSAFIRVRDVVMGQNQDSDLKDSPLLANVQNISFIVYPPWASELTSIAESPKVSNLHFRCLAAHTHVYRARYAWYSGTFKKYDKDFPPAPALNFISVAKNKHFQSENKLNLLWLNKVENPHNGPSALLVLKSNWFLF